jgi:hypothetical protein
MSEIAILTLIPIGFLIVTILSFVVFKEFFKKDLNTVWNWTFGIVEIFGIVILIAIWV